MLSLEVPWKGFASSSRCDRHSQKSNLHKTNDQLASTKERGHSCLKADLLRASKTVRGMRARRPRCPESQHELVQSLRLTQAPCSPKLDIWNNLASMHIYVSISARSYRIFLRLCPLTRAKAPLFNGCEPCLIMLNPSLLCRSNVIRRQERQGRVLFQVGSKLGIWF